MQWCIAIFRRYTHAIDPILLNKLRSYIIFVKLDCDIQSAPKFNAGCIEIDIVLKPFD